MKKWQDILVPASTSIFNTMDIIDKSTLQFAVVINEKKQLLGTVTDGDIRRGILKGLNLDTSISEVMNTSPLYEIEGKRHSYYRKVLRTKKIKQLPVVNTERQIIDIIFIEDKGEYKKSNPVVLMAGGLGTRLQPLTNETPKPMLKLGGKPILETIIDGFKDAGFYNFIITVNYKKEVIKEYFGDGSSMGINITYVEESKRLGTAGALSLLEKKPELPFFVMNGDLLTKINYEQLLNFHKEMDSFGTMCVREFEYQIPYGVIETENHKLLSIEEKPTHRTFVNAGIYVLNHEVLKYVPSDTFFDMPDLFKTLLSNNHETSAFPVREYWMDIGRMADFEKANGEFIEYFPEGVNR
ncbi:nucleotidyltransferase family protein [Litchfieldia salsa]|uniref:CBS domain-containing protein n=1 Tax=Litchfieldia salsa TaxID=930152 RepID=A0A1H0WDG0_9BACI|nr:nucleotidyltransferase family protein [Litchfieldia salsa]SDP88780.1 CBS domain-containing protein [Litchfieldia salsa]